VAGTQVGITEAQFQRMVTDLCDWLHLRWYHTHDSRRSPGGFPDLVIVGPAQVVYVELKSEKGRVTPAQKEWIDALCGALQDAYIWRPSDWPEAQRVLTMLAKGTL